MTAGITANVLSYEADCTNGGITSEAKTLTTVALIDRTGPTPVTLTGKDLSTVYAAVSERRPACAIIVDSILGGTVRRVRFVPATVNEDGTATINDNGMSGGNYATVSMSGLTSRALDIISGGTGFVAAYPVHDRFEGARR